MKISYDWLKDFTDLKKYPVSKLADLLTMNFAEVDGIEEVGGDSVFDLKILPDRSSDCLSHFGVAREIAGLANLRLKTKDLKLKVKENKKEKIGDILDVENQNPEICKRYVARVIKNVKIGPSPKWLSQRLEVLGQKSINNVVDATNYVMFEMGQPLHAFDLEKVKGVEILNPKSEILNKSQITNHKSQISKIIIRKAKEGEKIVTFDGQNIDLNEEILVIADNKEPLAIAGVKGGKKAEVDSNTRNIILESASFSAESIRKASRLTEVKTDSSIRFAADLDPNLAGIAMERLASLINQIASGKVVSGKIDIYPRKVPNYKVGFSINDASNLLGIDISEKEVLSILKRLNFSIKKVNPLREILRLLPKLKGKPYKYGASVSFDAPNAFDCSSFVSYVFLQSGIQIPRMAVDQYFFSDAVSNKDAKAGDLVFANTGILKRKIDYKSIEFMKGMKIKEGIDHVGIYLGKGKVMHASEGKGIIIEDVKKLKFFEGKKFRGFRRIKDVEKSEIFVIEIPTYRRDIKLKADIVEEIGRVYGYENISSKSPAGLLVPPKRNDELFWESMAKNAMVSAGFSETYNYSFIGENDLKNIAFGKGHVAQLENYLSDDRKYLRPNLLFGFMNNIKDNLRYFDVVRIFELGRTFSVDESRNILEKKLLGGVVGYNASEGKALEFYEIKGAIDLLVSELGAPYARYEDYKVYPNSFEDNIWHNFRIAEIKIGNENVGFVGEINPRILDAYGIKNRVATFEIDFEKLARLASEEHAYRPISKYPAVERDLAILVPNQIKVDDVSCIIENSGSRLLVDADLFDIYEGENIPEGQKSLAFHLIFQSQERTLSDNEVGKIIDDIILAVQEKGWEIRI